MLSRFKEHDVSCHYCGQKWKDRHPDLPGAIIWCGDCEKYKKCDQCQAAMIQGVYCHETGCPAAWKDEKRECKWCGSSFKPEERHQQFCDDSCYRSYNGIEE